MADALAVMANSDADYERLGLSRTSIEPREDGARTDDSAGSYEWWYFDAHLADGAKLVVTFMNKDIAEPQKPLSPLLRLNLDLPDDRHFEKIVHYQPGDWAHLIGGGLDGGGRLPQRTLLITAEHQRSQLLAAGIGQLPD